MTKWLALLFACLALGLVGAGCGGDDDGGGGGGDEAAGGEARKEQPAGGGGGAAAPKSATVSMKNISFEPADVTVAKGGTVTWTNDDSVGHDVTKSGGPGKGFKSGSPGGMGSGDTFEHTFDTAGKIEYVCTVHPGMEGTVTVK
jgi:plastocyanin